MKRVAVTGASGHLGANLVRELIDRGYSVTAVLHRSSASLAGLDIEAVQADLLDQQSLIEAFNGVEQVYHLAAYISIQSGDAEKLQSINVDGTRHVVNACEAAGVRTLVYFSSIHALDQNPVELPVSEDNPLLVRAQCAVGEYDFSKAEADLLVRENNHEALSTRIIYPTGVLGPHDFNQSLFGQAIQQLANGQLPALVAGGFNWVDARDVAWGSVEAAEKGNDKDRFILAGHYMSMTGVAKIIARHTGIAAPRFSCPIWLARIFAPLLQVWARWRNQDPLYTQDSLNALSGNKVISHNRATQTLGYQPRSFERSMRDTLAFYARKNLIQSLKESA